jgi:actin related protein 2/3 complex, subunit 2
LHRRPSSLDMHFVDFDNVRFHLSTPERKTQLLLSMSIRCWDELVQYGANDIIKREYGQYVSPQVEPQYNVTLQIDLEHVPPEGGAFVVFLKNELLLTANRLQRPVMHLSSQFHC